MNGNVQYQVINQPIQSEGHSQNVIVVVPEPEIPDFVAVQAPLKADAYHGYPQPVNNQCNQHVHPKSVPDDPSMIYCLAVLSFFIPLAGLISMCCLSMLSMTNVSHSFLPILY